MRAWTTWLCCVFLLGVAIAGPPGPDNLRRPLCGAGCENLEPNLEVQRHHPAGSEQWREPAWSKWLANRYGGAAEFRTRDGRRVDVLDRTTAWEVEWAPKWEESVGQSVGYAAQTGKQPGIWLLVRELQADDERATLPGDAKGMRQCMEALKWLRARGVTIRLRIAHVPARP